MGGYRWYELLQEASAPFYIKETSIFAPRVSPFQLTDYCFPPLMEDDERSLAFDVFSPCAFQPALFNPVYEDLLQIEMTLLGSSYNRVVHRRRRGVSDLYLRSLCDRVAALESKLDQALKGRKIEAVVDRKYSCTAEIGGRTKRKYKWLAEIKGKDDEKWTYTWETTVGSEKGEKRESGESKKNGEKKKNKKKKQQTGKRSPKFRTVEIEEPSDHGTAILRQAFARRDACGGNKGKQEEFSPHAAAVRIQIAFREYLIRRSRVLRALRELAIAKTRLKEIRAMFHNFSYRSRVARDLEERQKFTEKIIVPLLTVGTIEGADVTVRSAKRSMVDELEAMLDVVDPQPAGRSLSMRRTTFDMPSGDIQEEIAEGVAQVVQMLHE